MSCELPTTPAELPTNVVDTLDDYLSGLLRHVTSYAEKSAIGASNNAENAGKVDYVNYPNFAVAIANLDCVNNPHMVQNANYASSEPPNPSDAELW